MLLDLIIYGGISGVTVFLGGLLANFFNHHIGEGVLKKEITHTAMSFGAGIILSAVALVLVPRGLKDLDLLPLIFSFMLGAVLFMLLETFLQKRGGNVSTVLAMMMDFLPESIALGAVFALEPRMATLLAVFIALQNLPEAFNAFRDLVKGGLSPRRTLVLFFFLSFFGVFGALIGHFFLGDNPKLTAHLMTFASGGILYLLIQDIIPDSKMEKTHWVSLGASLGFLVGIMSEKLV